jgi:hypothetical protein
VQWIDLPMPPLPDGGQPAGVFGTTVLYHLLSTMDYAHGTLILRRKDEPTHRTGNDLPLWLAGDHYPCTLGSLRDYGPRIVTLDTGGLGHGLDTTVEIAERAGIPVDYAHPTQINGTTVYPIIPNRIALGRAVGRDVPGMAVSAIWPGLPGPGQSAMFGFDVMANFTHEYFKPFAITFDYTAMRLSVTHSAARRSRPSATLAGPPTAQYGQTDSAIESAVSVRAVKASVCADFAAALRPSGSGPVSCR